MPKRLILLLDGTWNDSESGDNDTNIVRLDDLIVSHLRKMGAKPSTPAPDAVSGGNAKVQAMRSEGRDNFVFYLRGVGTGIKDRFSGGVFGKGLTDNIRRAYKFLSFYYEPGDQIFVFGFSRGAYTARSVVGYIASAGLLKREACTREREEAAWTFYETPPNDRMPADWEALREYVHDRNTFRIACVGVFDTVGALGVPLTFRFFTKKNRQQFAFHNVTLSSITDHNLHAVAIDEQRPPFEATLWRRPRYKDINTKTEQVWFTGVHSDVGGGYVSARDRLQKGFCSLDEISLDWMIKRLKCHYSDFPIDGLSTLNDEVWATAHQHNSRGIPYKLLFDKAFRALANRPVPTLKSRQRIASYDRRDTPIGEYVHISAISRLGCKVNKSGPFYKIYRPKNLVTILDAIDASYGVDPDQATIRIVGWDGHELPKEAALKAVSDARGRLGIRQPA